MSKEDKIQIKEKNKNDRKLKKQREKEDLDRRRNRPIRWDKLDNTAHLFPVIAGESMSNVYRISITLREEIQSDILQEALRMVLPKFDGFNLRLRRGLFWFYFEENGKPAPRVVEEHTFPCRYIQQNNNQSYLFRVTYYECRINLEVFHVLTDGMGGLNFLRELTYQYLRLGHPELRDIAGDTLSDSTSLNREDSFVKNFKKASPRGYLKQKAYLIKQEKMPAGEFGVIHGLMPVSELKKVSHQYGASINEYLVAVFAWSIYVECLHKMPSKAPIRVAVPVNLRPFFDSVTTKNFFIMVSAEFAPERADYTFQEVIDLIKTSLRAQITKEHLENLFSYSVAGQQNRFARPVPLFLKNAYMKSVYTQSALANTTTVTNIGNIQIDDAYKPYIDRFHAYIAMSKGQSIKGTICSYGDTLVFSITSIYSETSIQRVFFRKIAADGVCVQIESNGVYDE